MFIDYAKAFDTVDHDALWTTLKEFDVPPHLSWLLKMLYDETKVSVESETIIKLCSPLKEVSDKAVIYHRYCL